MRAPNANYVILVDGQQSMRGLIYLVPPEIIRRVLIGRSGRFSERNWKEKHC